MPYTYILKSLKDNKYYIGCTTDIVQSLNQHNTGKVKSTKYRTPLIIIKTEEYNTLSHARIRENYLKSLNGGNEFKKIVNQSNK